MAAGLYQCTALQSRARPADRSGSHYRNGFGVVSLSQNLAEETQRVIHGGAPFLSTLTSLGVGQIKPPKWARPTCQKQTPSDRAKISVEAPKESALTKFLARYTPR